MREPFDAAILDYELPDTNGIRLAKRLRNLQPDLPVILFSGREDIPTDETHEINAVVSKTDSAFRVLAVLTCLMPNAVA
jgi:DNA-binding response OmpR family regulator